METFKYLGSQKEQIKFIMKKAYIYPITAYLHKTIANPYLENFMDSLGKEFCFLNKDKPSDKGVFDLINYFRTIDYMFLNWIEDLPDKKAGFLQVILFILLVYVSKLRGTKIVWTMHNKLSHYNTNYIFKRLLFRFVLMNSDFIITHSSEGIRYASEYNFKKYKRIRYFPHPIEKKFIRLNENPAYDILIWGSIIPYKGIDKFLAFLYAKNLENKYRILISGKVKPDSYESIITGFCNDKIHLDNRYVPEEDLIARIADSKTVIFTYVGNSVLSSGALMDTLSYGGYVLAPRVGAFKDAEEVHLISTFKTYEDLIPLLDMRIKAAASGKNEIIEKFIDENNWHRFARKVAEWIG